MADGSVTTTFFANERDAQAAIVRLEKKYADLEEKIRRIKDESRRSSEESSSFLGRWAMRTASVVTGYLSIRDAIGRVMDINREMIAQWDQAALKYDRFFRKFQVQSGQSALQTQASRDRISANAIRTATKPEFAAELTTELVGEGFSAEEASGESGLALMELSKATGSEVDPKALARSFAMILNAKGLKKTAVNVRKLAVAIQRLFKETSLRTEDMTDLAAKLEVSGTKTPIESDLAVFDLLRQEMPADVAATGFKIFFDRLQTAAVRPGDARLLARAGIKATDVDLVGEDIDTVLERLDAGLSKLPENIQNMILSGVFEERGRLAASLLIRRRKELPGLIGKMRDAAGFSKDVTAATTGKDAGRTRYELIKEREDAARDTGTVDLMNAAERLALDRGQFPLQAKVNRLAAEAASSLWMPDDSALKFGFGGLGAITNVLRAFPVFGQVMGSFADLAGAAAGIAVTPAEARAKRNELESGDIGQLNRLIEESNKTLKEIRDSLAPRARREGVGAP